MNNIATNLKKLRLEKGWTQQEMADKLFVTRQAVSNWENGKTEPDADMLIKISAILDVDINKLLYNEIKGKADYPKKHNKILDKTLVLYIILLAVSLFFRLALPAINNAMSYSGPVSNVLKFKLDLYWKLSKYLMPGYAVAIGLTEFLIAALLIRLMKVKFTPIDKKIQTVFTTVHIICLFFVTLHFTAMFTGMFDSPVFTAINNILNSVPKPVNTINGFLKYSALMEHRRWHFAVLGVIYEITRPLKNNNMNEKTPVAE